MGIKQNYYRCHWLLWFRPYKMTHHTSQICSKCGHWEEGQRIDQAHFRCKEYGTELNADFNAARNIAKSVEFVK